VTLHAAFPSSGSTMWRVHHGDIMVSQYYHVTRHLSMLGQQFTKIPAGHHIT